uniref:Uncharacterized protein n=1 Tax=Cacopsylla melanoneura TaxID=428564 RepID=A0A8D8U9X1_9HEMI
MKIFHFPLASQLVYLLLLPFSLEIFCLLYCKHFLRHKNCKPQKEYHLTVKISSWQFSPRLAFCCRQCKLVKISFRVPPKLLLVNEIYVNMKNKMRLEKIMFSKRKIKCFLLFFPPKS